MTKGKAGGGVGSCARHAALPSGTAPAARCPLTGSTARVGPTAGWKSKIRLGKTIWERPDNGFYVSQEMALLLMDGGENYR